ncbi:hypothetical protein [Neomoorella humiferrea]|uniref:hypothetical protein n=1 Tax=Neomoorella humiferrea TaxID=676965 RepID=UPI0030D350A9
MPFVSWEGRGNVVGKGRDGGGGGEGGIFFGGAIFLFSIGQSPYLFKLIMLKATRKPTPPMKANIENKFKPKVIFEKRFPWPLLTPLPKKNSSAIFIWRWQARALTWKEIKVLSMLKEKQNHAIIK